MQSVQLTQARHIRGTSKTALTIRSASSVRKACKHVACAHPGQQDAHRGPASQLLLLAATIAPVLIPLRAFAEDQILIADGIPTSEILSIAAVAVPAVAFGAVTLVYQARQANEDKSLRMKAIDKHKTFLSTQEEEEPEVALPVAPITSSVMSSSGVPPQSSTSSSDEPDTAPPAMLDQPERPEPRIPSRDEEAGSSQSPDADKHPKLPPQTAVLDRPDRPEPESSHDDAADMHNDLTQQTGAFAWSRDEHPDSARPSSPANKEEAAARDAEYQAKMRGLKGSRMGSPTHLTSRRAMPAQHPAQPRPQGTDMAAEYAVKMAALHEESAARGEADLRKRRERYALLAKLQAQAQKSPPMVKELQVRQGRSLQAEEVLTAIIAFLSRPLQWLTTLARKLMGVHHQRREQSAVV